MNRQSKHGCNTSLSIGSRLLAIVCGAVLLGISVGGEVRFDTSHAATSHVRVSSPQHPSSIQLLPAPSIPAPHAHLQPSHTLHTPPATLPSMQPHSHPSSSPRFLKPSPIHPAPNAPAIAVHPATPSLHPAPLPDGVGHRCWMEHDGGKARGWCDIVSISAMLFSLVEIQFGDDTDSMSIKVLLQRHMLNSQSPTSSPWLANCQLSLRTSRMRIMNLGVNDAESRGLADEGNNTSNKDIHLCFRSVCSLSFEVYCSRSAVGGWNAAVRLGNHVECMCVFSFCCSKSFEIVLKAG